MADVDESLSFLFLGEGSVGKTAIIYRYNEKEFKDNSADIPTIGIEFVVTTTVVDGKRVKLNIWDTAGQERFRTITSTYYHKADGIFLVYDISNKDSFSQIKYWVKDVSLKGPPSIQFMLIGNKSDLAFEREVTTLMGEELSKDLEAPFLEVSAKTGENIDKMFDELARQCLKNTKREAPREAITLDKEPSDSELKNKEESSCC